MTKEEIIFNMDENSLDFFIKIEEEKNLHKKKELEE
ncbi:hypothetical protein TPELB_23900 [Terrisporobacter petrolearius]|uniref:Uncharacterized protein n=1 Tax=Terrisporobacter petrolearius TaxID=1460447 RepID=A0ABZ3FE47_9FIRM